MNSPNKQILFELVRANSNQTYVMTFCILDTMVPLSGANIWDIDWMRPLLAYYNNSWHTWVHPEYTSRLYATAGQTSLHWILICHKNRCGNVRCLRVFPTGKKAIEYSGIVSAWRLKPQIWSICIVASNEIHLWNVLSAEVRLGVRFVAYDMFLE